MCADLVKSPGTITANRHDIVTGRRRSLANLPIVRSFSIACAVGLAALAVAVYAVPERAAQPPAPGPAPGRRESAVPSVQALPAPPPAFVPAPVAAPPRSALAARPAPERPAPSRVEAELIALEERARRRIDVIPILEAAGIDVRALQARPDADDVMRKVAADEVLTRGFMRDTFESTIYPYGLPADQVARDARGSAVSAMAALTLEDRIATLERELDRPNNDEPEPRFYGPESGRIYQASEDASAHD